MNPIEMMAQFMKFHPDIAVVGGRIAVAALLIELFFGPIPWPSFKKKQK